MFSDNLTDAAYAFHKTELDETIETVHHNILATLLLRRITMETLSQFYNASRTVLNFITEVLIEVSEPELSQI